jgi:hypothetical protein
LATVVVGSSVAFIWTVFPKSSTERTILREDLSATFFLLANYFSVINTAMKAQMQEEAGDIEAPGSPAHQLRKVRGHIYSKLMLLIPGLKDHAEWQRWEPRIGGRFPIETYEELIRRCTSVLDYLTLMSYSLSWKPVDREREAEEHISLAWLKALRQVLACISPMHHTILSTLALLSNSLLSGRSLPPFMPLPEPYEITRQVLELNPSLQDAGHILANEDPVSMNVNDGDKLADGIGKDDDASEASGSEVYGMPSGRELLNPDNMEQPGYTEFAVMQVCGTLLCGDLEEMIRCVSSLVGVLDFSFRIDDSSGDLTEVPTASSDINVNMPSENGEEGSLRRRNSGKGKREGSNDD